LTCLAVHWIGWFSPSCLLYVWLLLALGMFVLCFFSMGACSRFCLGYWLPSSLYILFLFATFVALLPLILIYSYIWSKKKKNLHTQIPISSLFPYNWDFFFFIINKWQEWLLTTITSGWSHLNVFDFLKEIIKFFLFS